jgi:hypothetical protein
LIRIPYRDPSINIERDETDSLRFDNNDEEPVQDLRNTINIIEDQSAMNGSLLLDSINDGNNLDQMSDYDRLGSMD